MSIQLFDKIHRRLIVDMPKTINKSIPLGMAMMTPFIINLENSVGEAINISTTLVVVNSGQKQSQLFQTMVITKPLFESSVVEYDSFAQLQVKSYGFLATENKLIEKPQIQYGSLEKQFLQEYRQQNQITTQPLTLPSEETFLCPNESSLKVYRRHEDVSRIVTACKRGLQCLKQSEHLTNKQQLFVRSSLVRTVLDEVTTVVVQYIAPVNPTLLQNSEPGNLRVADWYIEPKPVVIEGVKRSQGSQLVSGELVIKIIPVKQGLQKLTGWSFICQNCVRSCAEIVCLDVQ